jgi:hypothetical protein
MWSDKKFKKWYKKTHGKKFTGIFINSVEELEKYGFIIERPMTPNDPSSATGAENQGDKYVQPL